MAPSCFAVWTLQAELRDRRAVHLWVCSPSESKNRKVWLGFPLGHLLCGPAMLHYRAQGDVSTDCASPQTQGPASTGCASLQTQGAMSTGCASPQTQGPASTDCVSPTLRVWHPLAVPLPKPRVLLPLVVPLPGFRVLHPLAVPFSTDSCFPLAPCLCHWVTLAIFPVPLAVGFPRTKGRWR